MDAETQKGLEALAKGVYPIATKMADVLAAELVREGGNRTVAGMNDLLARMEADMVQAGANEDFANITKMTAVGIFRFKAEHGAELFFQDV